MRQPRLSQDGLSNSVRWWIWGLPIAFIVHDGEEAIAALKAGRLQSIGVPLTPSQTLAAMGFELAVFWSLAVVAVWSGRPGRAMQIFGIALAGYTLHGMVHLTTAIFHSGYALGADTALPAAIAYGALALYRLHAERLLTGKQILTGFAISALAGVPFLYLVHLIGLLIG